MYDVDPVLAAHPGDGAGGLKERLGAAPGNPDDVYSISRGRLQKSFFAVAIEGETSHVGLAFNRIGITDPVDEHAFNAAVTHRMDQMQHTDGPRSRRGFR